ncbi:MAG: hypothetical protein H8D41_00195 [bacterium]|nr:hypothetical protein [Candidatus Thioglobus pontius]
MKGIILSLLLFASLSSFAIEHKVVIHLDQRGLKTQQLALNMANDLYESFGKNNVTVEVVVCGPGLDLVREDKERFVSRIEDMIDKGIVFTAGWGTMEKKLKKEGEYPELIDGVNLAASGAFRATELQEQGYSYLKP